MLLLRSIYWLLLLLLAIVATEGRLYVAWRRHHSLALEVSDVFQGSLRLIPASYRETALAAWWIVNLD